MPWGPAVEPALALMASSFTESWSFISICRVGPAGSSQAADVTHQAPAP